MKVLGWKTFTSLISTFLMGIYVENKHQKIHMLFKAKLITKENSKEFSNMFLDNVFKAYQTKK